MYSLQSKLFIYYLLYVYCNYDIYKKFQHEHTDLVNSPIHSYFKKNSDDNHFFVVSIDNEKAAIFMDELGKYMVQKSLNMDLITFKYKHFEIKNYSDQVLENMKYRVIDLLGEREEDENEKVDKKNPNFYINYQKDCYERFFPLEYNDILTKELCSTLSGEMKLVDCYTQQKHLKIFLLKDNLLKINPTSKMIIAKTFIQHIEECDFKIAMDKKIFFIAVFNTNYDEYCENNKNLHLEFIIILLKNYNYRDIFYFGNNKKEKDNYNSDTIGLKLSDKIRSFKKNLSYNEFLNQGEIINKKSISLKCMMDNKMLDITLKIEDIEIFTYSICIEITHSPDSIVCSGIEYAKECEEIYRTLHLINRLTTSIILTSDYQFSKIDSNYFDYFLIKKFFIKLKEHIPSNLPNEINIKLKEDSDRIILIELNEIINEIKKNSDESILIKLNEIINEIKTTSYNSSLIIINEIKENFDGTIAIRFNKVIDKIKENFNRSILIKINEVIHEIKKNSIGPFSIKINKFVFLEDLNSFFEYEPMKNDLLNLRISESFLSYDEVYEDIFSNKSDKNFLKSAITSKGEVLIEFLDKENHKQDFILQIISYNINETKYMINYTLKKILDSIFMIDDGNLYDYTENKNDTKSEFDKIKEFFKGIRTKIRESKNVHEFQNKDNFYIKMKKLFVQTKTFNNINSFKINNSDVEFFITEIISLIIKEIEGEDEKQNENKEVVEIMQNFSEKLIEEFMDEQRKGLFKNTCKIRVLGKDDNFKDTINMLIDKVISNISFADYIYDR